MSGSRREVEGIEVTYGNFLINNQVEPQKIDRAQ